MLEFVNLHKRYGDVRALDGCSFSVTPARVLGFLGPNGAGKTTAMRSVFGLVRLDGGSVRWMGRDVTREDRLRFGYMPEERGLYPRMHVHDQVAYFAEIHGLSKSAAQRAADAWLERLGLMDRALAKVEELSHGNQQRVQLAVALVHGGDLLVLDEPFAGLDPIGVSTLGEVIRDEAKRGAAVVFSSHQLDLVENLCDDVAIIDHGRIVLNGSLLDVREASRYRYVQMAIEPRDSAIDWGSLISGAEVVWERDREVRLLVPRDSDPGELLSQARKAGEVRSFRFEPPSISDLFVEAVR
jgi:ABC-2 type transport system ATP-binding protein